MRLFVKQFVAFATYYKKFNPYFFLFTKSIILQEKNTIFSWANEWQNWLDNIIQALLNPKPLSYSDYWFSFTLTVDASKTKIGLILSQINNPLSYDSKCFTKSEQTN